MAPPPAEKHMSSSRDPLPPKEHAIFKRLVNDYERKHYKHGIKLAKQILAEKRFAEHGETLAMKGLILNAMGKREEGWADVKRGLRNDLQSHVCWHVFGLIQRADKKYEEAIKAYRNALRYDADNLQILRDLSVLLVHMRDLNGYRDIRYRLLELRPSQRASWIGYAMSYHLLGNHDMTLKIIKEYNYKPDVEGGFDYEYSELLLYVNMVMREAGLLEEAITHLEENALYIYDKTQYMEEKGKCLQALDRSAAAISVYNQLVDRNPENVSYYYALEQCRGLTNSEADQEHRLAIYDAVADRHPRASACKRMPLTFLKGARFIERLRPYLIAGFRKGVPAMFQQLRKAYTDPARVIIIQQMILTFIKSLETTARFPEDNDAGEESPTTILWVYYYAAQHFDLEGDQRQAHYFIDRALSHTPTLIELIVSKAKFCKHAGDDLGGMRLMDTAQAMDTADRFINSKCAKYMMRAGKIDEAIAMCSKFTREGVNAAHNMNEMQCMWFANEAAYAHYAKGDYGEALKKCHEVDRHMTVMVDDQYDFHTYCVRKMTLTSYVKLLRLEDTIREHRFFYRSAVLAIRIYVTLHDNRANESNADNNEAISAADRRKAERKAKKAQAKADEERLARAAKEAKENPKKKAVDLEEEDASLKPLDPYTLTQTETPLDEALKFVRPLTTLFNRNVDAHVVAFEVYLRLGKVLPMLQCLVSGHRLAADNASLHICKIKFLIYQTANSSSWSDTVRAVVDECVPQVFAQCRDARLLNDTYLDAHNNVWPALVAHAEAEHHMAIAAGKPSPTVDRIVKLVTDQLHSLQGCTWKSCVDVLQRLAANRLGAISGEQLSALKARMSTRFPSCNALQSTPAKSAAVTPVQEAINGVHKLDIDG